MTQKHTKGPWILSESGLMGPKDRNRGGYWPYIERPGQPGFNIQSKNGIEFARADARLIAAAPEMKDQLIWSSAKIQDVMNEVSPETKIFKELQKILFGNHTALAKAEGR